MRTWVMLAAATSIVALLNAACSSDDDPEPTATTAAAPTTTATVTEPTPVATPSESVPIVENGYSAEEVFPQLDYDRMIEIDAIPGDDGAAVVVTQAGIVYRFSLADASVEPTVFLDISDRIISNAGNEEGLLGLAFAPDYEQSGWFYVNYSAGPPRQNTVSRFTANGAAADPTSEQKLITIDDPFGNHNGGGLEFGPDGYLYYGIGDGGSGGDPQGNGQDTSALLGKILRVDVSRETYAIPPDNPFANGGGAPEVFAYGFRNPWRISFDTETGGLWTGDVGQGTREEVNLVELGGNYGWNITEGDICYNADECDRTGLIEPRATYANGEDGNCSVTGGYVYHGVSMPELDGWYVYGDYCSGIVWAANTADDSEPVRIAETGLSIPGFWQDADGELYMLTFGNKVVKLVRN